MSQQRVTPEHPSRVKASVGFLTWEPSEPGGPINTTRRMQMVFSMWVNHPLDERFKPAQRGGEQAIKIAQRTAATKSMEWLGLTGLNVNLEDREDEIVNQPARSPGADAVEGDTGMRLV